MKRLFIFISCAVLLLGMATLLIPATRTATRTTLLPAARKQVFQAVTQVEDPSWRPSVGSVRVLKTEDGHEEWLEISKDGHELLFKTINKVEPELFEIEFSGNPSIRGHWSGRFIEQAENETRVEFTETVTAGSWPSKVLSFLFFDLDSTLDTYINDLKHKLEGAGHEQASS
jgi:ribosome-associated toxin RatA of RatAB toxin-antitoxin module